jgi:hypothetical protein
MSGGPSGPEVDVSDLYDQDVVLWSEQQADRLRRLAHGEKVNDVDWENVVEEIESVGRSQITAVQSLLLRALEHLLKAVAWPDAQSERKWLHEANVFLRDARLAWAPSMRSRMALSSLYESAREGVRDLDFEEGPPGPLPEQCPVTIDDLVAGNARDLIGRFRPGA